MAAPVALEDLLAKLSRSTAPISDDDRDHVRKAVGAKVTDLYGAMVEKELRRTHGGRGQNAKQVAARVTRSNEFRTKKQQLLKQCKAILHHGNNHQSATNALGLQDGVTRGHSFVSSFASEATFFAASMAQSMVIPGLRDVRRAAATLTQKDADAETKLEALKHLIQIPAATLGQTQEFLLIKKNLMTLLTDPVTADCSLLLLTKMFNAVCPTIVTGIYDTTLDVLTKCRQQQQMDIYLKVYRVWHKMLMACPTLWVRFPSQKMKYMVESTVAFIVASERTQLSADNADAVLAALDPTADWIKHWLHTADVRQTVVDCAVGCQLLHPLVQRLCTPSNPSPRKNSRSKIVFFNHSDSDLDQLLDNYALNVVMEAFSFENSRHLIITSGSATPKSAKQLLTKLINTWMQAEHKVLARTAKSGLILMSTKPAVTSLLLTENIQKTLLQVATKEPTMRAGIMKIIRQSLQNATAECIAQVDAGGYLATIALIDIMKQCFGKQQQQSSPENGEEAVLLLSQMANMHQTAERLKLMDIAFLKDIDMKSAEQSTRINSLRHALLDMNSGTTTVDDSTTALNTGIHQIDIKHTYQYIEGLRTLFGTVPSYSQQSNALHWICTEQNREYLSTDLAMQVWQTNIVQASLEDSRIAAIIKRVIDEISTEDLESNIARFGQLTFLSSNLDFVMWLRTEQLHTVLEKALRMCSASDDGRTTICAVTLTLARLYNSLFIAGPTEKPNVDDNFVKNFSSTPFTDKFKAEPSRFFTKSFNATSKYSNENLLGVFLEQLSKKKRPDLRSLIMQRVEHLRRTSTKDKQHTKQNWTTVIKYGVHLKLITDYEAAMQQAEGIMAEQKTANISDRPPTDWLAAVLFLLFHNDNRNLAAVLKKLPNLEYVECIWPSLVGSAAFVQAQADKVWPWVQRILLGDSKEYQTLTRALTQGGVPVFSLLLLWTNQSYINILDWPEVCYYTTLAIIGQPEIQAAYFCTVLLHLKEPIVLHSQTGQLIRYLTNPVELGEFKIQKYAGSLERMRSQLRPQ